MPAAALYGYGGDERVRARARLPRACGVTVRACEQVWASVRACVRACVRAGVCLFFLTLCGCDFKFCVRARDLAHVPVDAFT